MPEFDLPESQLWSHTTASQAPSDLHAFWVETLEESRLLARPVTIDLVPTGLSLVDTYDVTFSGFGGDPIRAWYHRPSNTSEDLPLVVRYQGYGGGRGLAHQVSMWPLAGYACLEVDSRGQGSEWRTGDTPDPHGSTASHPGFMTRGILDPRTYYFRRVYTDAVLGLEAAAQLPGADPHQLIVCGTSQGGGVALAVAGLSPLVSAVLADVPFLSDIERAIRITPRAPYTEVASYLALHRDHLQQVFRTLGYVDVALLVGQATAPALFSAALMDTICPPSTVFAAYNAYAGPKTMITYPFNDHEGGSVFHEVEQLTWLNDLSGAPGLPPRHGHPRPAVSKVSSG